MWNIIGNVSSVVTLFLFVIYIIGHLWRIIVSRNLLYEKFQMENMSNDEVEKVDKLIDLSGDNGEIFSVSSPNGIRKISLYKCKYIEETNCLEKEQLVSEFSNVNINEKVYVRGVIPEGVPNTYVELEKTDYVKIGFAVATSGKNGEFVKVDYKCKMTLKSWIYYMCS